MDEIEHELCGNCKKEIPQHNYVMHTAHCARNITLCPCCKEPVAKAQFADHKKGCNGGARPKTVKTVETKVETKLLSNTTTSSAILASKVVTGAKQKQQTSKSLLACKFCELELPKLELDEHENYCGSRTDKCLECGELVMYKYKQIHMDSNHGFLKLKDEPGPRPSWDSTTQRSASSTSFRTLYDDFPLPIRPKKDKSESYKEISRRLDCKTEYIRNLLHDSASITVPLRHNGAVPRNHFNHNKGPAPQPPPKRRPNPPAELSVPCEFCSVPIPHEDLVGHEMLCRPRRRARQATPDMEEYFFERQQEQLRQEQEDVELPCEFCADMIPASQLLRHQATCS